MLTTDIAKAEQKIKDAYRQMVKTQRPTTDSKDLKLERMKETKKSK